MKYEFLKINRWLVLILITIFIGIGILPLLQNKTNQTDVDSQKEQYYQENQELLQSAIHSMKATEAPADLIAVSEKELAAYQEGLSGITQKNKHQQITAESEIAKIQLEKAKNGNLLGATIPELELRIKELEFFVHSEIEWVDPFFTAVPPASHFLLNTFLQLSYPLLLSMGTLLIALFCSYEHRKNTANFMRSTPQKLSKIMWHKIGVMMLTLSGFLITGTLGIYLISVLKGGIGNFNYPIFYLDSQQIIHQTTIITYLLLLFFSTLLFFFLLTVIGYLLQNIFTQFLFIFLFLALCIFPLALGGMSTFIPVTIAKWLPTNYWDFPRLILGNNPWGAAAISFEKGIFLMVLSILLFFILNRILMKRSEVNINSQEISR